MHKTILVSGASGNLGYAVTLKLVESGYHVIALDGSTPREEYLEHQRILPILADLTDESAVYAFIEELRTKVDAAVLTVGGFTPGNFKETSGEAIQRMVRLNFETAYYLVRPLMSRFLSRGTGQFIMIGARPALEPQSGKEMVAYALSKSLLFTLSDMINAAGKGTRVHSTVIVPSTLDTPANRKAMPKSDFGAWVSPARIAETILFLLGETGSQVREGVIKVYNQS